MNKNLSRTLAGCIALWTLASSAQEIVPEDFNAHFQSTYIWRHQSGFNAPYRGTFSLPSEH